MACLSDRRDELAVRLKAHPDDGAGWAELFELMMFAIATQARRHLGLIGTGGDLDDLRQAGRQGVMRAVAAYDPSRGLRFTTIAPYYIRSEIQDCAARPGAAVTIPPQLRRAVVFGYATHYPAGCLDAARRVCDATVETIGFDDQGDSHAPAVPRDEPEAYD